MTDKQIATRIVNEAEVIPEATDATVEEAYAAVKGLLMPGVRYRIEWDELPVTNPIINRFKRELNCEAWLMARELGADGQPVRGGTIVAPIVITDRDYVAEEKRLRDRLAELEAAGE